MPFIDENSVRVIPAALTDWLPLIKSDECKEVILAEGSGEKESLWFPFYSWSFIARSSYSVASSPRQFLFYYGS